MNWHEIASTEDIDQLLEASMRRPQLLFKHSTRCNISATALARVERQAPKAGFEADYHLLYVIENRTVSNYAAERLEVFHESPQLIVLEKGEVLMEQAHYGIQLPEVADELARGPLFPPPLNP